MTDFEHTTLANRGNRVYLWAQAESLVAEGWEIVSNDGQTIELRRPKASPKKTKGATANEAEAEVRTDDTL